MVEFITEYDGAEELSEAQLDELRRVCEKVMENEDCDFDAEISLTFTDNEGIRAINAEYRGIDRATDVLSFPCLISRMTRRTQSLRQTGRWSCWVI